MPRRRTRRIVSRRRSLIVAALPGPRRGSPAGAPPPTPSTGDSTARVDDPRAVLRIGSGRPRVAGGGQQARNDGLPAQALGHQQRGDARDVRRGLRGPGELCVGVGALVEGREDVTGEQAGATRRGQAEAIAEAREEASVTVLVDRADAQQPAPAGGLLADRQAAVARRGDDHPPGVERAVDGAVDLSAGAEHGELLAEREVDHVRPLGHGVVDARGRDCPACVTCVALVVVRERGQQPLAVLALVRADGGRERDVARVSPQAPTPTAEFCSASRCAATGPGSASGGRSPPRSVPAISSSGLRSSGTKPDFMPK